ncbi:MAG: bifunctional adenosylcobinamide kinase/adenosylcobinamide-phosphate guanylyltransferase [Mycobacterium sp.]
MRTLVLGGIRSGKSDWAEADISRQSESGAVRYIATGPNPDSDEFRSDEAWAARIAAHRGRRPGTWDTVETADLSAHLRAQPGTATLVDDLGGWLTGALDRADWEHPVNAEIDELLAAVGDFTAPLLLVSPEVGMSVVPATAAGRRFADELGALNRRIAQRCERVVLVVAGQPVWVKPAAKEPF